MCLGTVPLLAPFEALAQLIVGALTLFPSRDPVEHPNPPILSVPHVDFPMFCLLKFPVRVPFVSHCLSGEGQKIRLGSSCDYISFPLIVSIAHLTALASITTLKDSLTEYSLR
ncbi:hypothetical protein Sjap_020027 [Stephania japonica]|uniref:Uncharacterized protein n=1 Tax=Stephania japonica TaxID=461633 RepID=A0AAP0F7C3_9MAGN